MSAPTDPADAAEVLRLWPDGVPDPIDDPPAEAELDALPGHAVGTQVRRNTSDPTLTVFTPPEGTGNGVGVIVVPGGGWMVLMWEHEGLNVARWLTLRGYTAFVLKYRVQPSRMDDEMFAGFLGLTDAIHQHVVPFAERPTAMGDLISTDGYLAARGWAADDGRRAVELARELAPRYGVRPDAIGMVGFSAGAFLAVDVAMDPRAEPMAFVAPIYGGETLGVPVPSDAPPMFAAVAHDDVLRRIVDGLYADWSAADRPAELHVFGRGQHGFGLVQQGAPSDRWAELFVGWLRDAGVTAPRATAVG